MSTKITYNSKTTEVANGKIATLSCNGKKMKSDIDIEATDSPLPIKVSTEAEMTALLTSGEVGGVYKYTGTTGTYENGALYVLEQTTGTFTIVYGGDGSEHTYSFDIGMTFTEFVASDYNTDDIFELNGTQVLWDNCGVNGITSETVIEDGGRYSTSASGGAG